MTGDEREGQTEIGGQLEAAAMGFETIMENSKRLLTEIKERGKILRESARSMRSLVADTHAQRARLRKNSGGRDSFV